MTHGSRLSALSLLICGALPDSSSAVTRTSVRQSRAPTLVFELSRERAKYNFPQYSDGIDSVPHTLQLGFIFGILGGFVLGAAVTSLVFLIKTKTSAASSTQKPQLGSLAEGGGSLESTAVDSEEPEEHRLSTRILVLAVMLLLQSMSSVILRSFQSLLTAYPSLVFFLTMLVGLGGNVGGQSVVFAVRQLSNQTVVSIPEQMRAGVIISVFICPVVLLRVATSDTSQFALMAICASSACIIFTAVIVGTGVPLLFHKFQCDPANSIAVIQVLMDIVGITILCLVGTFVSNIVML